MKRMMEREHPIINKIGPDGRYILRQKQTWPKKRNTQFHKYMEDGKKDTQHKGKK